MPETDKLHPAETFVTWRGTEFEIVADRGTGLYLIHMKAGGPRPPICEDKFTSYRYAVQTIENYLRDNHDRNGKAKYPSKEK